MRHRIRYLAVLASAALLPGLSGCGGDRPASTGTARAPGTVDRVTYLTGFNILGQDAFVYAAIEKGYFREAGLEVTVKPGKGTGENLKLLDAGQAQFVSVDLSGALVEHASGRHRDFAVFAAVYQRSVSCVTAVQGTGIARPKDLEGRTVGYAPGGVNFTLFPTYARLAGIDPAKVRWQLTTPTQLRPLLAAGKLDAIVESVISKDAVAVATGRPVVVLPYSDVLRDLYGNALAASTATITGNPRLVERFRDAMLRGLTYAVDHPEEAAGMFVTHQPAYAKDLALTEVRETIPFVRGDSGTPAGSVNELRVTQSIALLQAAGAIPAGLRADQVVSFGLAPRPSG